MISPGAERGRHSIAFLTPMVPAAGGNGLAMRAGLFLQGLARVGDVTVIVVPVVRAIERRDDLVERLASSCATLELASEAEDRAWPQTLLSTPAGRQRARDLYPLPALCRRPSADGWARLRELTGTASLVHVMRSYLAPCVDFILDEAARLPVTLDLDELDSSVQRQLGQGDEGERFERLERYYAPRVDHVCVASPDDRRVVREAYGAADVTTVVNAVTRPPSLAPAPRSYDLLLVGNLSYAPNAEGARWLCSDVLPLIGAVTVAIVGSSPGPDVRALADLDGVTVAADVPDVGWWYARSRLAVAPLHVGGGTRTKIAEALAHRRPVVATTLAAAGLCTGERYGIAVADTAQEFADACVRLLGDEASAERTAAAGAERIKTADEVAIEIGNLAEGLLGRRG
jgi:glycosyltransferase involved in cell wall biosynthesis